MNNATVEVLCSIIEQQAALIKDLSQVIEESRAIDDETKAAYCDRCAALDREVSKVY